VVLLISQIQYAALETKFEVVTRKKQTKHLLSILS